MDLNSSIALDSIIFYAVTVYIAIWIFRKKISFKEKLAYLLFFMIFNSSYNIMIKPIHDYNRVIPRNFIWNYDVLGPLSMMDVLFVGLFIINIIDIINSIKYSRFIRLVYIREFIFIFIGILSFFINKGYLLDNGSRFLIEIKGILYFFTTIILTLKYMKRSIKEVNYIQIFIIIILSGFVSTLLFDEKYLWIRYGMRIKIIDQEDAYTVSMFLILYYIFKKNKTIIDKILLFILFIQNILCVYKNNILIFVFSAIFSLLFYMRKNKKTQLLIVGAVEGLVVIILIMFNKIKELIFSEGIVTRLYQSSDFWLEMKQRGSYAITFGLGIGTPYFSEFNIGDGGEIKAIDKINNVFSQYRFTVQAPILGIFKYIGIAGFILYIIATLVLMIEVIKQIIRNKKYISIEFKAISLIVFYFIIMTISGVAVNGTSPMVIFIAFGISRMAMELKNLNNMKVGN